MLKDFYYNRLSNVEKIKYSDLYQGLRQYQSNIELTGTLDNKTVCFLVNEHPELFFCVLRDVSYWQSPFHAIAAPKYYLLKEDSKIVSERINHISKSIPSSSTEETICVFRCKTATFPLNCCNPFR